MIVAENLVPVPLPRLKGETPPPLNIFLWPYWNTIHGTLTIIRWCLPHGVLIRKHVGHEVAISHLASFKMVVVETHRASRTDNSEASLNTYCSVYNCECFSWNDKEDAWLINCRRDDILVASLSPLHRERDRFPVSARGGISIPGRSRKTNRGDRF